MLHGPCQSFFLARDMPTRTPCAEATGGGFFPAGPLPARFALLGAGGGHAKEKAHLVLAE